MLPNMYAWRAPEVGSVAQRPSLDSIEASLRFLQAHEALGVDERITPLGFVLSLLPVDFIIAKMLVLGTVRGTVPL